MRQLCFKRHRFPPDVIRHSIWLYARFTFSYRDVEEMLAERGLDVSYETVRRWCLKFGSTIAANLRRARLCLLKTSSAPTNAHAQDRRSAETGAENQGFPRWMRF